MAYNYEYPYVDTQQYNDDWLIKKVLEIAQEWATYFPQWQEDIEQQNKLIEKIQEDISKIVDLSPGFLESLIAGAVRNVWFGLTDSGYFCAYVPQSWQSIQFATTGYDTTVPTMLEYGHLCLYDRNYGNGSLIYFDNGGNRNV